jgi:hypothetical protein
MEESNARMKGGKYSLSKKARNYRETELAHIGDNQCPTGNMI